METMPPDSQAELVALRMLVAEQATKISEQEAEVSKRDSIIELLRAQLALLRHQQHGASSEKIDRKIEQFELILEEIEASRAEAELRSGKPPLPALDDASEKPKRRPLPNGLLTEDQVYAAPCNCPTCGGMSFLKAADRVVQVMEHVPASVKIVRHIEKRMVCRYDGVWRYAGFANRARQAWARIARPYHGRQVRRSHTALPPLRDVRPAWGRYLSLCHGGLGGACVGSTCAAHLASQSSHCSG
jgi:hypothetical protein